MTVELELIYYICNKNKMETITEKIEFTSENKLIKGVLHLPEQNKNLLSKPGTKPCRSTNIKYEKPCIVIGSHGLEGSKESDKQIALAKALPMEGIAFLRFDHRGCGESDGDFKTDTSLDKRSMDMVNAVKYMLSLKITNGKIALFGSSLGGSTCIAAWQKLVLAGIKPAGAVLCSALVKSRTVKKIPFKGNNRRPALPFDFFKKNLLFDLSRQISFMNNVLIFHGDRDETVPVQNAREIYINTNSPKKLIIHKNGDHRMSSKKNQREFLKESIAWFHDCFATPRPYTFQG